MPRKPRIATAEIAEWQDDVLNGMPAWNNSVEQYSPDCLLVVFDAPHVVNSLSLCCVDRTASRECATKESSGLVLEAGQSEQNILAVKVFALHITSGHCT